MSKSKKRNHDLVPRNTVARFYYQGTHSHPIRRTVLVIEETKDHITGYEIREGSVVRSISETRETIRKYRKDKIAKWGDYSRLRMSAKNYLNDPNETTLVRESVQTMFTKGP